MLWSKSRTSTLEEQDWLVMPDVRPWQYTNFGTMRYWRQFGGTNVNMIIKYIRDKRLTIFFEILPRISNFLGPLFSAPESITDDLTTLMDRLKLHWSYSSLCWQNTAHLAIESLKGFQNDKNRTFPLSGRFQRFSAYQLCH